jgi:hypothetical protein
MKICKSRYKNIDALTLENECLKVQFTPEFGGKMLSLIHKKTSREILQQAKSPEYKVLDYDGEFVKAECSGFDDMFPTIDRVVYPDHPWKGVEMPDHGEVCGLKWEYDIKEDSIYMAVNGVRFPFKMEKWITFTGENSINIDYKATNNCYFNMDFLWTAHVMVDAGNGGEILLPYKDNQDARIAFTTDEKLGRFGDTVTWPQARDKDGRVRQVNIVRSRDEEDLDALKYYFKGRMPEGWCGYRYKEDGTRLILSFPTDSVPYLGILTSKTHGLILEPCTATMDRPDMAKLFNQNSVLMAKGTYSWYLKIQII